ncbi:MAG: outer membrane beta-barrel protein [Sulfurovum sp.]|nr:outer membrane beta-barrel protein [Sulfurovum sp.]
MLQVGYKINPYFAFEGRYWVGMSDQSWENTFGDGLTAQVDTWGLYTKLFLPATDSFNVYALLGYAEATYSIDGNNFEQGNDAFDGFSWGLGTDVSFSDNVGVFIDYVALYDDYYTNYRGNDANIRIDSLNVGMTYTF